MIKIVCVLKSGGEYDERYVENLYNAIRRNCFENFQFVCLNDVDNKTEFPLLNDWSGWWSKIELFRLTGKVLYFDLDTIILKDISNMIQVVNNLKENEFIGVKAFNPRRNLYEKTMFNSGVMGWNGDFKFIYDNFDFEKESNNPDKECIGDQDYISRELREKKINIKFWQNEMIGLYSYKRHCKEGLPEDARVVCFHGHPRPHQVVKEIAWVRDNWKDIRN